MRRNSVVLPMLLPLLLGACSTAPERRATISPSDYVASCEGLAYERGTKGMDDCLAYMHRTHDPAPAAESGVNWGRALGAIGAGLMMGAAAMAAATPAPPPRPVMCTSWLHGQWVSTTCQ